MTKRWDHYEEVIRKLYKNKSLREVQKIMVEEHGFKASTRAYRGRLDRWGIHKYNSKKRRGSATSQEDNEEVSSPVSVHAAMHTASRGLPVRYTAEHTIKQEHDVAQSSEFGYRWSPEDKATEHDEAISQQPEGGANHHLHWDGRGWQSDSSSSAHNCINLGGSAEYASVYIGVPMSGPPHNANSCGVELAQTSLWAPRSHSGYYMGSEQSHCHRMPA